MYINKPMVFSLAPANCAEMQVSFELKIHKPSICLLATLREQDSVDPWHCWLSG
jgi:hypothetical protein